MKEIKCFLIAIALFLTSASALGQGNSFFNEFGEIATNLPTSGPKEGLRPIQFLNPRADDVVWQKVVYRMIDLRERINAPLFFPEESVDGRQNLFTLIFRLKQEGKIVGFEYQASREVFTDEFRVDFGQMLERLEIFYQSEIDPLTNERIFMIDESDIPNREVLVYFLKEVWFFDKHTSTFNVKTLAIYPVLFREDFETGILQRIPLFWIPFDMLRPHLSQTEVMLSDRNNGMRISFDDLFIKRRYGSYIYKVSNIQNRMFLEFRSTAQDVRREQNAVRTALINFENDLWEY